MKKNTQIKAVLVVLALLLTVTATATLSVADSDPLVTLSYINETVIPKITEDVKNAVLAVINSGTTAPDNTDTPDSTAAPEATQPTDPETQEPPAETEIPEAPAVTPEDLNPLKYSVVYLEKGQKLMASGENTESTEIVLRAGQVVSVSPFSDQGIADLTASKELYDNDPLVKNNYCIIPRGGDGRGIHAVNSDAYILVRGEYEIVSE